MRCIEALLAAFVVTASVSAAVSDSVQPVAIPPVLTGVIADSVMRTDTASLVGDTEYSPGIDSLSVPAAVPRCDTVTQTNIQPASDTAKPGVVPALTDTTSRIAVVCFIGRGIDSLMAIGISDRFRLLLSNYSALPVMGLPEMYDTLNVHGWPASRVCDHNDCFIDMGRALGVRYILGGSAGKIGGLLTIAIRLIDVKSGRVLLFKLIDTRREIGDILTGMVPELAVEFNNKMHEAGSPVVAIQSEPSGAEVGFDQTPIGVTPVLLKNIRPGPHDVHLNLPRYRDVADTLTLESGRNGGKRYVLELAGAPAAAHRDKLRVAWAMRGAGLFGAIASLSIGFQYNTRLGPSEAALQRIVDEYNSFGSDADASLYTERYRHQAKQFETWTAYRNLCYAAGALLAAGVGVTFLF